MSDKDRVVRPRGPMGGGGHGMSAPVEKPKDFKGTWKKLIKYCKK